MGRETERKEVIQDEQYVGNMLNLMLAISLITHQSKAMVISVQLESQVWIVPHIKCRNNCGPLHRSRYYKQARFQGFHLHVL